MGVFDEDGVATVELAVMRGEAELVSDRGVVTVNAGTRALARQGEFPSQPMAFNSARWDAFDQWSQDRLAARRGAESAQYVPPPLQSYGTVLDSNGEAVVEMPEWFSALNREFRYLLTPLGASMPGLYVAEEISDNRFKIAGGVAGKKVSWQVTGIRQDAWANKHRIPVEEEKSEVERGFYLHPGERS